jgi:CMP-N-acetylneuraminic acid synthetase/spore coat polysaccharide biosynthesis predicted glycosyltransferase SpsG
MNMKKILVVIPARGGSKTIPRKNMRRLNGKPLISYPIMIAKESKEYLVGKNISVDICVTTDDRFIAEYVENIHSDVKLILRSNELGEDSIPLDPVIYNAAKQMEDRSKYDAVITLLPTAPLLTVKTLLDAIDLFFKSKEESLVLVNEATHLYWRGGKLITERKNRQYLEPIYEETGGIVISDRDFLFKEKERVSNNPFLYVCPVQESIDINTWYDFLIAEHLSQRKKIGFKVSGNFKEGFGHVYRCITLALRLLGHDLVFFVDERKDKEAAEIINSYFFELEFFKDTSDLLNKLKDRDIDLVINDTRGLDREFAEYLDSSIKLVSINENSENNVFCDMVINPEFEFTNSIQGLYGYKYNVVREDVLILPVKEFTESVKNVLITMGGSDPEGVTVKILRFLEGFNGDLNFRIIVGTNFQHDDKNKISEIVNRNANMTIVDDVQFMGYYLYETDLLISSNSSTIYDSICLGGLTISISKAKEEIAHLFSRLSGAVVYLGHHEEITKEDLIHAIDQLRSDKTYRRFLQETARSYAGEIRDGQREVINKIYDVLGMIK